jgi:hypothetical protein
MRRGRHLLYKLIIGSLFRTGKHNVTVVNKPDENFNQVWLDESCYDAVGFDVNPVKLE